MIPCLTGFFRGGCNRTLPQISNLGLFFFSVFRVATPPPPNTTRDNTTRDNTTRDNTTPYNTTRDNTTRDNTTPDNTTPDNTTLLQVEELEEEEDFDDTETWGFRTPVKHGSGEIHLEEEVQKEVLEGALQGALQGVQTGAQDGVQCNGGSDPVVSHRPHNGLFCKV